MGSSLGCHYSSLKNRQHTEAKLIAIFTIKGNVCILVQIHHVVGTLLK